MAIRGLLTNGTWTTGTWRRVEAFSLDWDFGNNTYDALTTARTVNVTFANAGNQVGIFLPIRDGTVTTGKTITIELLEGTTVRTTDVFNEGTGNWVKASGLGHLLYFPLTSYAVTTAAATWKYRVTSSSGSGSQWARSATASDWGYAVVLDADASTPSDGDAILLADGCTYTVDANQSIGSGDSTVDRGMWLGSKTTFKWDDSDSGQPADSYTLTLGSEARIWVAPDAVVTIGSLANPISVAKQAVIDITLSLSGFVSSTSQFAGQQNCTTTIDIHGAEQSDVHAIVASDAANGQADVVTTTDMSSAWAVGQAVTCYGKLRAGHDTVEYTIAAIDGTKVTLSSNLDYKLLAGGAIVNKNQGQNAGVKFTNTGSSDYRYVLGVNTRMISCTGLYCYHCSLGSLSIIRRENANLLRNIFVDSTSYALRPVTQLAWGNVGYYVTTKGIRDTVSNIYYYILKGSLDCRITLTLGLTDVSNVFIKCFQQIAAVTLSGTYCTLNTAVIGSYSYNTSTYGISLSGAAGTYTNVLITGGTTNSHFYLSSLYNAVFTNCVADYASQYNLFLSTVINCEFNNCEFGANQPATIGDIYNNTDTLCQCIFKNTFVGTTGLPNVLNALVGSFLRLHTYNVVADDHRSYMPYGYIVSTGDGLTDTTVHTSGSGKFAIRFESADSTNRLEWSFKTPTGSILGLTMTVAVWVKINAAAYYGGTHQKPRLTIDYDNGTEAYAEATASTDWQLLSVTFAPTTSYGQIEITLSTMTDQTGSNAYVYFDDFAVLYPAGYKLDLGGMDLWADALPITPPIATVLSAGDVWTVPASGLTGTGTIGQILNALVTGRYHFDKAGGIETIKDSSGNTVATFTVVDTATEVTKT